MIKNLILSAGLALGLAMLAPLAPSAEAQGLYNPYVGDLMNGSVTLPPFTNSLPGIVTVSNANIIDVYPGVPLALFPNVTPPLAGSTSNVVFQFSVGPGTIPNQTGQGLPLGATNLSTVTNLTASVPLSAVTNAAGNIVGYTLLLPTTLAGARKFTLTSIYNYSTNTTPTNQTVVSNCWWSVMQVAPR